MAPCSSATSPRQSTLGQATDLQAAANAYRAYLTTQAGQLAAAVGRLRDAISAGDVPRARQAYLDARLIYGRVELAARNFGDAEPAGVVDLDQAIDPSPTDAVSGFPRLASGLWGGSTVGLVGAADDLQGEVGQLEARFAAIHLDAVEIAAGAPRLLGELVDDALAGRAEPLSHSDLTDVQGVVEGTQAVLDAVRTPLHDRDPNLEGQVSTRLASVERELAALQTPTGYPQIVSVPADALRALAEAIDASADSLASVARALSRPVGS